MARRLAIIGGGPSALFLLRRLVDQKAIDFQIDIFEQEKVLGPGFPYSLAGAGPGLVTNVSGNEIPELPEPLTRWVKHNQALAEPYLNGGTSHLSDYHVVPRLLFGEYLSKQFNIYLKLAKTAGVTVNLYMQTKITRLQTRTQNEKISVSSDAKSFGDFDTVVVCTGHRWPVKREGRIKNHFDSPYPPAKLKTLVNLPVHIKGSSLTAIDAIRTLARVNGKFERDEKEVLHFIPNNDAPDFSIILKSRHGLLPGLRFHLEDPHLLKNGLLSREDIMRHRDHNNGFVSMDFIFEQNFKNQFIKADPDFYQLIREWKMEEFVGAALSSFASEDPFGLFAAEYADSLLSIRNKKSEYWKEKLAVLSVAMNFPAKYLSAEDTQRFHEYLMPLISVVIAFVPQASAEELLAMNKSGRLCLLTGDGEAQDNMPAYIDCAGQPHLGLKEFPFQDLVLSGDVSQAKVRYQDQDNMMDVDGLAITDSFRAIDNTGKPHPNLFLMAVPYIGGFNPDYSGLDFCEEAACSIVKDLMNDTALVES